MRRFSIFIVVIFLFQCHSDKGTGVDYDIFSNKIIFSKDKAFHRFNRINKKEIEINSFLSTKNAIFEVQNDTLVYFTVFNLAVVNKYKIVIHDTIAKIEKVSSKIDTKLVHNIDTFKYCAYFIKSNNRIYVLRDCAQSFSKIKDGLSIGKYPYYEKVNFGFQYNKYNNSEKKYKQSEIFYQSVWATFIRDLH